ncbi:hypothetical protein HOG48_05115 [Candidatus Peregrinibacteria bacterium]|jgi:hypothetical protein|nr:hypothetical protein [Candidatus Peregrinibacteria bacterium]
MTTTVKLPNIFSSVKMFTSLPVGELKEHLDEITFQGAKEEEISKENENKA